ncbi:MAG: type II toxin-antitoxin system VapC family toxin [Candidatus Levyibacteriota bacterium]
MNILLDTCSYIWLRTEPQKLSKYAAELIKDKENNFFLSVISLWEINLKIKIGKLHLEGELESLTNSQDFEDIIKPLSFYTKDAEQVIKMKLHHKDPFDLMLISQAMTNSYTILTPDPFIRKYSIKTMW